MFQITDFVARMDILCSKFEVCLPLANPSTIYNNFPSLKPFDALGLWFILLLKQVLRNAQLHWENASCKFFVLMQGTNKMISSIKALSRLIGQTRSTDIVF